MSTLRERDRAAARCQTCLQPMGATPDDDDRHLMTRAECAAIRATIGGCADPTYHHDYLPGAFRDPPVFQAVEPERDRHDLLLAGDDLKAAIVALVGESVYVRGGKSRLAKAVARWLEVTG